MRVPPNLSLLPMFLVAYKRTGRHDLKKKEKKERKKGREHWAWMKRVEKIREKRVKNYILLIWLNYKYYFILSFK